MKEEEEHRESSIESIEQWETSIAVQEALTIIKEQLKTTSATNIDLNLSLLLRGYEGYTLNELAKEQEVSHARISQRLLSIERMLRHPKITKQLAKMLDIPYKKYHYFG